MHVLQLLQVFYWLSTAGSDLHVKSTICKNVLIWKEKCIVTINWLILLLLKSFVGYNSNALTEIYHIWKQLWIITGIHRKSCWMVVGVGRSSGRRSGRCMTVFWTLCSQVDGICMTLFLVSKVEICGNKKQGQRFILNRPTWSLRRYRRGSSWDVSESTTCCNCMSRFTGETKWFFLFELLWFLLLALLLSELRALPPELPLEVEGLLLLSPPSNFWLVLGPVGGPNLCDWILRADLRFTLRGVIGLSLSSIVFPPTCWSLESPPVGGIPMGARL